MKIVLKHLTYEHCYNLQFTSLNIIFDNDIIIIISSNFIFFLSDMKHIYIFSVIDDFTNRFLIPLAIPLLLFDSNLRRVITDTGSLLLAFIIGSFSTVISTILTYKILPLKSLGENGWKISSALAARHIGGAINFVSVCETLNVNDGSIVSAAIAADNVVVALYFAFLFYLAVPGDNEEDRDVKEDEGHGQEVKQHIDLEERDIVKNSRGKSDSESITLLSLSVSLAVASCLVTLGKIVTGIALPTGTSVSMIVFV